MKKVCIIETGGTIGRLKELPERTSVPGIEITVVPLMIKDSNNIVPRDWIDIAAKIVEGCKNGFDGIVLTHGTDTLGYTSIALSYILRDLNVPVAVTGSMIPGHVENTDAIRNLQSSVVFAAKADIAEVCVIFSASESGSEAVVIRGCRARKVSSKKLSAFQSINVPPVGYVKDESVSLDGGVVLRRRVQSKPYLAPNLDTGITLVKFHPALSLSTLETILDSSTGVVIEGYGTGQIRTDDKTILAALRRFKGPIALATQCHEGGVALDPENQEPDRIALTIPNLIPVQDMLPEAALIKLMWVLGNGWNPYELMNRDVAGEISSPNGKTPSMAD